MGYQDMAALSLPMYGSTIRSNNIDNSLRDTAPKRFLMPNAANWRVHLRKDADPLILRFIHRQVMGRNLDRHDIRALHKQSNFFFYGDMKNIDQRTFFLRILINRRVDFTAVSISHQIGYEDGSPSLRRFLRVIRRSSS